VFFWSEEHARAHRRQHGGVKGIYLSLQQNQLFAPVAQEVPFEFARCPAAPE